MGWLPDIETVPITMALANGQPHATPSRGFLPHAPSTTSRGPGSLFLSLPTLGLVQPQPHLPQSFTNVYRASPQESQPELTILTDTMPKPPSPSPSLHSEFFHCCLFVTSTNHATS
ncbi:hypothetical protein E2C01_081018 [Portunus trituberculatus]|uniref:Uncharacterized protein n=1 Tax=Portunus trituberculatus TaxID=210409 RepID=A0A5B7INQ7_PORTR|nr:hypothetical protein [Portunus trituberculatus]